jgi:type IV/VI secretion system ImpK/VasF family protein
MMTITNEQLSGDEKDLTDTTYRPTDFLTDNKPTLATTLDTDIETQLLLSSTLAVHHPKAGLNPLVDAAACLFSIMGKLKNAHSSHELHKLHDDLMHEVQLFQDTAKSHGYGSEYILVSRYAVCATLDDIITHTAWGSESQWHQQSLLAAFKQDTGTPERFFVILERLIKDPHLYIDVMELMYLCLSLGFKGHYRALEQQPQLEQITQSLYKRIRAYRGDFSKLLSPFPIRPTPQQPPAKSEPDWLVILLAATIGLLLIIGIRFVLHNDANPIYQELARMGKLISYETDDSTTR